MRHKDLLIIAIVLTFLAGCAASGPSAAPTGAPGPVQPTGTPLPSRTPVPTETSRPTLTPTITATPLPSATPTPGPDPALAETDLIGLAWYENYDLMLSFQFPGPVDPEQYRVTFEEKEYLCEVITAYPDRLYCRGQGAKVLAAAWVRIYPAGSQTAGFEKQVWTPYFDNDYSSFYH